MNLYFVYGSGPDARIVTPELTGDAAARHHPRLAAHAGRRPRLPRRGGHDLDRRVAGRQRQRRADRGVRLRHRRRHHAGRRGQERRRRVDGRRRQRRARSRMQLRAGLLDVQTGAGPRHARLDAPTRLTCEGVQMDTGQHIQVVQSAADQLLRAATSAGPQAPVPSCPGWTADRLVRHVTRVHHWAAAVLRRGRPEAGGVRAALGGRADRGLPARRAAPGRRPDHHPRGRAVWTFYPADSPVAFWARRQAHETTIHRVDAELAAGTGVMEIDPDLAADGLAELLIDLAPARLPRLVRARHVHHDPDAAGRQPAVDGTAGAHTVATVEEAARPQ